MTRKVVLALAGVAALVALGVLFFRAGRTDEAAAPTAPASADEATRAELQLGAEWAADTRVTARSAALVDELAVAGPSAEAIEALPHCVVTGRVVDQHGAPIAGARAILYGFREWRQGADAGERVRSPHVAPHVVHIGFETETDAEGSFSFDVPVPTAQYPAVAIDAGPFHSTARVIFGRGNLGALVEGERDVGTIALQSTGAVRGRVVDARGAPLARVALDVGASPAGFHQLTTWSDEDGTFVLGHAPPGDQFLKASATGFLDLVPMPISIVAGRILDVGDVILAAAPTIEGIVRSIGGRPVAGVSISGRTEQRGGYVRTTSDANGRFALHLREDARYTLAAQSTGYERWGDEFDRSVLFEPGTRDVVIELTALPKIRFVVVDGATGERVERFGLEIVPRDARGFTGDLRRPPVKDQPADGVLAHARERIDLCLVAADAYLYEPRLVEADAPGMAVQTVRLERGAVLRGVVTAGGTPVRGASIVVEEWSTYGTDPATGAVRGEIGPRSAPSTSSGASGAFTLVGVAPGEHRLTIAPPRGTALVEFVTVPSVGDIDLGEFALAPGGVIVGELLTPPGVEPSGITVNLGHEPDAVRTRTDERGHFRFENVPAGRHPLRASASAGRLVHGARTIVEVLSGETAAVTLDARDFGACDVELLVLVNDEPWALAYVSIRTPGSSAPIQLGRTDHEGRVRGQARSGRDVTISISRGATYVTHPSVRLDLAISGRVEETVRFELGELVLRWPDDPALPAVGRASIEFTPLGSLAAPFTRSGLLHGAREVRLADVPVGRYGVTLELVAQGAHPRHVERADGSIALEWDVAWTGRTDAIVSRGGANECRVE